MMMRDYYLSKPTCVNKEKGKKKSKSCVSVLISDVSEILTA